MSDSRKIIISTGEKGVKEYLTQFFKNLNIDEKDIPLKVEEAFQSITNNPDVPNMFGISVKKLEV